MGTLEEMKKLLKEAREANARQARQIIRNELGSLPKDIEDEAVKIYLYIARDQFDKTGQVSTVLSLNWVRAQLREAGLLR